MMQASIRTDRAVIQMGESLGDRTDCTLVELKAQEITDLRAAFAQPHGLIYLAANGVVTADPPAAPPPPPADQPAFDAAVTQLRNTFNTNRTAAQVNNSLDALTVLMRRVFRELS